MQSRDIFQLLDICCGSYATTKLGCHGGTVGNAIVDIIARAEDDFLVKEDIIKGAMNLIDADRAEHLYSVMGPAIEASGGSAGNTAAGVASFGGKAAYFGKVADDHLGTVFAHDIHAIGVHYETKPLAGTPPTAHSMIFTTPDGERSMNTYLGACVELGPEDVDAEEIEATVTDGILRVSMPKCESKQKSRKIEVKKP